MKSRLAIATRPGALALATFNQAHAQYTPPPPPAPFPGFINRYLSSLNGYTNHWNIGGADRERYVAYEGYAVAGKAGSADFRNQGASVDNQYLLSRIRLHVGYFDDWWSAYAEAESSLADGDHRAAYANAPAVLNTSKTIGYGPESDEIDLHQGFFTVGNTNEFPLMVKVGRQELVYGEERLIGAFDWNNIGRSFDAAKVRWLNDWGSVDLFTGMPVVPVDGRFDLPNTQDWFSGAYATIAKFPGPCSIFISSPATLRARPLTCLFRSAISATHRTRCLYRRRALEVGSRPALEL